MVLYNGKTTTTMLLLCNDPDPVDGETSGFGTASLHEKSLGSFSKESLLLMKCIFPFRKPRLVGLMLACPPLMWSVAGSRPGHHNNGTDCLPVWHACNIVGIDCAARLSKRSMGTCT